MTTVPTDVLFTALALLCLVLLSLGFVIGAVWEGCRRGGSLDLELRLAEAEIDLDAALARYARTDMPLVAVELQRDQAQRRRWLAVLERREVRRWERLAQALGGKADDAEGLAQVLDLAQQFEDAAMTAVTRLRADGYSWAYLARGAGVSRQALQQRHARFLTRSEPVAGDGVRAGCASAAKDAPRGGPACPPGYLASEPATSVLRATA